MTEKLKKKKKQIKKKKYQLTSTVLYSLFWFLDPSKLKPLGFLEMELPLYTQNSTHLTWLGDAGLGLTPHDPVQNDPVWRFICKFKKTSHI